MRLAGEDREQRVAVDDAAEVADGDEAISISIVCDAEVRTVSEDGLPHDLGMRRSAAVVDVGAVGTAVDRDDLCTELPVDLWCDV